MIRLAVGILAIPGGAHDLGNLLVVFAHGAAPGRVGGRERRRSGAVGGPYAGSGPDRHYLFTAPRRISDPSLTLYFGKSINRPAKRANHSGMIERS